MFCDMANMVCRHVALCARCAIAATGKKKASRWIKKLPMKQRGTKEKAAGDQLADDVAEGAAKLYKSVTSFFD